MAALKQIKAKGEIALILMEDDFATVGGDSLTLHSLGAMKNCPERK